MEFPLRIQDLRLVLLRFHAGLQEIDLRYVPGCQAALIHRNQALQVRKRVLLLRDHQARVKCIDEGVGGQTMQGANGVLVVAARGA